MFGVPDDDWGERVHAAVQLRPGHAADRGRVCGPSRASTWRTTRCRARCRSTTSFPRDSAGKLVEAGAPRPSLGGPRRAHLAAPTGLGSDMPTPFVDRHDELEFLGFALKRARAGQGQVVAVVGEPGVGKSRLLDELTRAEPRAGLATCSPATALPGGELPSYAPDRAAPPRPPSASARTSRRRARRRDALAAWTAAAGGAMLEALPALQSVLDVPVDDPGVAHARCRRSAASAPSTRSPTPSRAAASSARRSSSART